MKRSFVSPGRYVQGSHVLSSLGSRVEQFGERALLVADETVLEVVQADVERSFAETDCDLTVAQFEGECTTDEIVRLTTRARDAGVDVILGVGGGKAIDTAKSVRAAVGGTMVSVPTIASTDAPTSGISVLYDSSGRLESGRIHDQRPELVLVDTAVVAAAPTRYFVAGIGDALATEYEAAAAADSDGETVAGGRPTRAGRALARECGDVLREHGRAAVTAVDRDEVTPAVDDVTEAIVLLSGLGFENGGLAAAHAIHDGLTHVVSHDVLHGEKVCVGLFAQFALEDRPDAEVRSVESFAADVGLPTRPGEIGLDTTDDERLATVAKTACHPETTMSNQPGSVTETDVVDALRALDRAD